MSENKQENFFLTVDNIKVPIEGERNILEVIRKAKIEIPTLCYNSELSIHGGCRMCMVELEGRGLVASCSVPPVDGMVIRSNTKEVRGIRKTVLELVLANHHQNCYTCGKSTVCNLQQLAKDYGINNIRFKRREKESPIDVGLCITRDPDKCILCGQCIRMCSEIQSVGCIGFGFRSSDAEVLTAFNKNIDETECVGCGQCTQVCPTGALMNTSNIKDVWQYLNDPTKTVVVQIAPAVRTAIGEPFGFAPGEVTTDKMVTALKAMGFDYVFDTCFGADLTIMEEATEFVSRVKNGGTFPMVTSCCPGWVNFAESFYPDFEKNLSSCRSPQEMFSSVIKSYGPKMWGINRKDLKVISIMPCTAKKEEKDKDKFKIEGDPNTDFSITTQEFAQMIKECGIDFRNLADTPFDHPFGEKTGAGVIFGSSGGVAEAALRFIMDFDENPPAEHDFAFKAVRGMEGIKSAGIELNGQKFNIAVASGLANTRKLLNDVKAGKVSYDFIEIMACSGGCLNGGGQPTSKDRDYKLKRMAGIYKNDVDQKLHKSQQNPDIIKLYKDYLESPGSHEAHHKLHTHYEDKNLKKKYGVEK
ncbi:MAG: 4Fe-4S dicluster domain-containing protein [bacterium]|nr:4Fe-4S dicluster domain-containing protein [bacterium]